MELRIKLVERLKNLEKGFVFDSPIGRGLGAFSSEKAHKVNDEIVVEVDTESNFDFSKNSFEISADEDYGLKYENNRNVMSGIIEDILDESNAILLIGEHRFIFEYEGVIRKGASVRLELGVLDLYEIEY